MNWFKAEFIVERRWGLLQGTDFQVKRSTVRVPSKIHKQIIPLLGLNKIEIAEVRLKKWYYAKNQSEADNLFIDKIIGDCRKNKWKFSEWRDESSRNP